MKIAPMELESYGCDWYTCTARSRADREEAEAIAHELIIQEASRGWDVLRGGLRTYNTVRAGGIALGIRSEDTCVRLSGDLARTQWRKFWPLSATVSRFDAQCTYRMKQVAPRVALEAYQHGLRPWKRRGRPPTFRLNQDSNGGATCYIGARTSDRHCRIYDKGVQSGEAEPGTLWRFEMEYKRRLARATAELMMTEQPGYESFQRTLVGELERVGITLIQGVTGRSVEDKSCRPTCTAERRLKWLRTQVQPSIVKLIEMGYFQETLTALGLDEIACIEVPEFHPKPRLQ